MRKGISKMEIKNYITEANNLEMERIAHYFGGDTAFVDSDEDDKIIYHLEIQDD